MFKNRCITSFLLIGVSLLASSTFSSCEKKENKESQINIVEFEGNKVSKKIKISANKTYGLASYIRADDKIYEDYNFEIIDPNNVRVGVENLIVFYTVLPGTYTFKFNLAESVRNATLYFSVAEVRSADTDNAFEVTTDDNDKFLFIRFSSVDNNASPFINTNDGQYIETFDDPTLPYFFKEPTVFSSHAKKISVLTLKKRGDLYHYYYSDNRIEKSPIENDFYLFAHFNNIKNNDTIIKIYRIYKLSVDLLLPHKPTVNIDEPVYFELNNLDVDKLYQIYIRKQTVVAEKTIIKNFPYFIYDSNFNLLVNIKEVKKAIIEVYNIPTETTSSIIDFAYVCKKSNNINDIKMDDNVIMITASIEDKFSSISYNLSKFTFTNLKAGNYHLCFIDKSNQGQTYAFGAPMTLTLLINGNRFDFSDDSFEDTEIGGCHSYKQKESIEIKNTTDTVVISDTIINYYEFTTFHPGSLIDIKLIADEKL